MKRVFLTLLFCALSCLSLVYGQATIRISPDTTAFPSPQQAIYNFNDSVYYQFIISNIGSDTLFTQVAITQTVNGAQPRFDSLPLTILAPGDSFFAGYSDTILAGRYGGGINVVVIWPSAANTIVTGDSAIGEVLVEGLSNLTEEGLSPYEWNIYPNPSASLLHLETNVESYMVKKTSLFALDGRIVYEFNGLPTQIDLGDLPEGMYWLKIGLKDGREEYFRLAKKQ